MHVMVAVRPEIGKDIQQERNTSDCSYEVYTTRVTHKLSL